MCLPSLPLYVPPEKSPALRVQDSKAMITQGRTISSLPKNLRSVSPIFPYTRNILIRSMHLPAGWSGSIVRTLAFQVWIFFSSLWSTCIQLVWFLQSPVYKGVLLSDMQSKGFQDWVILGKKNTCVYACVCERERDRDWPHFQLSFILVFFLIKLCTDTTGSFVWSFIPYSLCKNSGSLHRRVPGKTFTGLFSPSFLQAI